MKKAKDYKNVINLDCSALYGVLRNNFAFLFTFNFQLLFSKAPCYLH